MPFGIFVGNPICFCYSVGLGRLIGVFVQLYHCVRRLVGVWQQMCFSVGGFGTFESLGSGVVRQGCASFLGMSYGRMFSPASLLC